VDSDVPEALDELIELIETVPGAFRGEFPFGGLLTALLFLIVAAGISAVPRPASASAAIQPRPDAAGTVWLCRPGQQPDPCTASLATTVIEPNGSRHIVRYEDATDPPIDCFYLYPNITHQRAANADLDVDPQQMAIAELEASPFSQVCRVFAPIYREATGQGSARARGVAYASALGAWHDYLAHYNDGRGIVLVGHSEGSAVLAELLTKQIVPLPQVGARVVSAVLTGLDFPVLSPSDLVPCESAVQIHCIVDFNAYSGAPPSDARFGELPTLHGEPVEDICTNPASLTGGTGALDSMYRITLATQDVDGSVTEGILPKPVAHVSTPWVEFAGEYSAECASSGGRHVLIVGANGEAPELRSYPNASLGLHVDDPNLAMGNLVNLVRSQARAYTSPQDYSATN
jgi:hypothetical protein